jgi:hypothetical protein
MIQDYSPGYPHDTVSCISIFITIVMNSNEIIYMSKIVNKSDIKHKTTRAPDESGI